MNCTRALTRAARISSNFSPVNSSLCKGRSFIDYGHQPRHLLSIADLTANEFEILVRRALEHRHALKTAPHSQWPLATKLAGQVIGVSFSKRSTRTRVSTEGAVVAMGGHPMFLGKDDIQLGVNEPLLDTAIVISSMVAGIVARVGPHSDVETLAKHSSVPVINALSDKFHPKQTVADFATLMQKFGNNVQGLKLAWVGDANNVLYDLCIGARKLGVDVSIATPKGYEVPSEMMDIIQASGDKGKINTTLVPEEAVKNADVIVTDTWVSMGQESEYKRRVKAFEGFQVSEDLAKQGGARKNWAFMHCLPRHQEEVTDEVYYGPRSLVFPEAENRLWAAISVFEAFFVNKGKIQ